MLTRPLCSLNVQLGISRGQPMNNNHNRIGSIWSRWDLHLHAPGTKLSDCFGGASDQNLKRYVDELEASDVKVFGITDYFSFDGYLATKEAYAKHYPDGKKQFFFLGKWPSGHPSTKWFRTPNFRGHSHRRRIFRTAFFSGQKTAFLFR